MGWDPRKDLENAYNDVKREASNAAQQVNQWTGGAAGQYFDPLNLSGINNPPPPPGPPPEDPRITKQRTELTEEAKKYRAELPRLKQERYTALANEGTEQLSGVTKGIRTSANQRGLLYSGLRQNEEAGARGRMASMLAAQRAEINREAEELASTKEEAAANVGLAGFADAQKRAETQYNQILQNEIARRKGLAQIGRGVGRGFGSYYGRKSGERIPVTPDPGEE